MDNNQKVLAMYGSVVLSFAIAGIFQYAFALTGWGLTVAVTLCALSNLYCLTAPQSVESYLGAPFRTVLFVIALIAGGVFGLMFMTLTWTAIYLVAIVAATMFAIARS
jgi:hypothetical protein